MSTNPDHQAARGVLPIPGRLVVYFLLDLSESYRPHLQNALEFVRQLLDQGRTAYDQTPQELLYFSVIGMDGQAFQAFPVMVASQAQRALDHAALDLFPQTPVSDLPDAMKVLADSLSREVIDIGSGGDARPLVVILTDATSLRASQPLLPETLSRLRECRNWVSVLPNGKTMPADYAGFWQQPILRERHTVCSMTDREAVFQNHLLPCVELHRGDRNTYSQAWPNLFPRQAYIIPHIDWGAVAPAPPWPRFIPLRAHAGQEVTLRLPAHGPAKLELQLHEWISESVTVKDGSPADMVLRLPQAMPEHTLLRGDLVVSGLASPNQTRIIPVIGWVEPEIASALAPGTPPAARRWFSTILAAIIVLMLLTGLGWMLYRDQRPRISLIPAFPVESRLLYQPGQTISDPLAFHLQYQGNMPANVSVLLRCKLDVDWYNRPGDPQHVEQHHTDDVLTYLLQGTDQEISFHYIQNSDPQGTTYVIKGDIEVSTSNPGIQVNPRVFHIERWIGPQP